MEVKVVRSQRRKRSVSARLVNGLLLVNAPLMLSQGYLDEIINSFKLKFSRKKIKDELDKKENLRDLARELNKKYFDNQLKIESIEYVTTQNSRLGCCNYRTGRIRISHKIGLMPKWVRKYVLVHEMAHLIEPNHSRAFWDIVLRYRFTERARGYLMAAGSIK
ncbi:MAG: M48 family metallopeptidase [Candidatus Omnitrophica bacterium]|nr:M48 family metallopeptidase [Candidatus Omnitrophota bacterium]